MNERKVERFRDLRPGDILVGWGMRFLVLNIGIGRECLNVDWFNMKTQERYTAEFDPCRYIWIHNLEVLGYPSARLKETLDDT